MCADGSGASKSKGTMLKTDVPVRSLVVINVKHTLRIVTRHNSTGGVIYLNVPESRIHPYTTKVPWSSAFIYFS